MTDQEAERILQQLAKKMADDTMEMLCSSGAFESPRPTALRLTPGGAFEVVELYDDGTVIDPPKPCPKCGTLLCSEHMGT
jgi:hypothetical protein